jgi:4-hydroxy-2-oxoheptanedioate aldolase
MQPSRVREVIAEGGTAITGWLSSESGYLAETLSHCGYDAVTVDLQHGMFGLDTAIRLVQAISAGPADPFVRCPSQDPAVIGSLLDAGAYGLICPSVDTPEQAASLVAACRYPPVGRRSYGPARSALDAGPRYLEQADSTVMVWAMIESLEGLRAVREIAAVPGLDGLFVGPNDLALALGVAPAQLEPPVEVERAWGVVLETARAARIAAGTFCTSTAIAVRLAGLGYDLVAPGSDAMLLRAAARGVVATVRGSRRD